MLQQVPIFHTGPYLILSQRLRQNRIINNIDEPARTGSDQTTRLIKHDTHPISKQLIRYVIVTDSSTNEVPTQVNRINISETDV